MGIQSFRYEFTMKEALYFFFKKKKCPKCGGTMIKEKSFELVDGKTFTGDQVPLYITREKEVKHYYYTFTCPKCGARYTLAELSK